MTDADKIGCIHPDCEKPATSRGCCPMHLWRIKRALDRGEYTEEDAVEQGILRAKKPPGGNRRPRRIRKG